MAIIGHIGLGAMGGRIASRLLDAGHTVVGYNRTRSKAQWLIDKGMRWADTPRDVARAADCVIVMVTDSASLESVAQAPDGFLNGVRPETVIIDMSTISPSTSRAIAERVRQAGGDMVDAPVSGSVLTLEQNKLSIMVGGRASTFDRVKPLLDAIGPKVTHVGDNGLALSMKIAINLSLTVQMLAFSEGVLLAEKSGIARETAVDVLTHSAVASPLLQYRGPMVLGLPAEAWFDVAMMQKDMRLVQELGRELDVPLPTAAISSEFLTAAHAMGLAQEDFAAIFNVLASLAGRPPASRRG
jgi:3-hydroxyisobutyrate dehydrogenase-like beta-hydroxyacid dehydrogenase